MRAYKIGDTGIIEEVYEEAPEGALDTYNKESGIYLESAVNKLIAQSVRYQEYISAKQKLRELKVEVEDTSEELERIRGVLKDTSGKNDRLTEELNEKTKLMNDTKRELNEIHKYIEKTLGGAK